MVRAAMLSLLWFACGCGGGEPPTLPSTHGAESSASTTPTAPETPATEPPACQVSETHDLASPSSAPRLVALALDDSGGLLLWVDAAGATNTLALDADARGRGEPQAIELPDASGLLALARVGSGCVVVTEGACATASHCLQALRLDAEGARAGEPAITELPSAPLTLRRRVLGAKLLLAISTTHAAPRLITWTPTPTGLHAQERVLAQGAWPEEADATILALTTDETRWAALYRVGATEAPTSHVVLALANGLFEVPTLEHALAVDALAFEGDGLMALVSYEFFRPKLHRLHFDGSAHVEARELLPGASLPSVFRGQRRASLEHGDHLDFMLLTPAGDRVGPLLSVVDEGRAPADVGRIGDDYVVAAFVRDRIEALRVACRPESSP